MYVAIFLQGLTSSEESDVIHLDCMSNGYLHFFFYNGLNRNPSWQWSVRMEDSDIPAV